MAAPLCIPIKFKNYFFFHFVAAVVYNMILLESLMILHSITTNNLSPYIANLSI